MRLFLPLVALTVPVMALGADSPSPLEDAPPSPPALRYQTPAPAPDGCRDRITLVREERGLLRLQREMAEPEEPLLIAGVDKRIEGCSVLVMKDNVSDIRPLPSRPKGPPMLRRLPAQ